MNFRSIKKVYFDTIGCSNSETGQAARFGPCQITNKSEYYVNIFCMLYLDYLLSMKMTYSFMKKQFVEWGKKFLVCSFLIDMYSQNCDSYSNDSLMLTLTKSISYYHDRWPNSRSICHIKTLNSSMEWLSLRFKAKWLQWNWEISLTKHLVAYQKLLYCLIYHDNNVFKLIILTYRLISSLERFIFILIFTMLVLIKTFDQFKSVVLCGKNGYFNACRFSCVIWNNSFSISSFDDKNNTGTCIHTHTHIYKNIISNVHTEVRDQDKFYIIIHCSDNCM